MAVALRRRNTPALIDGDGELVTLDLLPISADDAGRLLPKIQEHIKAARRYEQFLVDAVTSEMVARGQTERRIDATVYEYKPEASWRITDEPGLLAVLQGAGQRGEVTLAEIEQAVDYGLAYRFNNTALNVLAKRVPEIQKFRERVEGTPRLKAKSSK